MRTNKTQVIAFSLALLLLPSAFAQKIKVRKVKGNQAVVDYSGTTLVPGQVYNLEDEFGTSKEAISFPRKYFVDLSAGFSNSKADIAGANSLTQVDLTAVFGWNYINFEIGPALAFSYTSSGGVSTNTVLAGGYADWNILPNAEGEIFTYGLGVFALAGKTTVVEEEMTTFRLQPGAFTKWFIRGTNAGFRFNLAYQYDYYQGSQKESGTSGGSSSGFIGSVGIISYF